MVTVTMASLQDSVLPRLEERPLPLGWSGWREE
jgi:hypothetical protein